MRPRPYLSYSQMQLVERSPETYRKVYVEGQDSFSNSAMDFGSKIGKFLENDELSGNPTTDLVLSQIPRYDLPDLSFHVQLRNGRYPIPLIAKPDSMKADYSAILEYKTGKTSWTQGKVDKNDQLTFYATCVYLSKGFIPALELVWAETETEVDEVLNIPLKVVRFTGKIKRFKTSRNVGDCLRMMKRMKDAWELIQEITEKVLV